LTERAVVHAARITARESGVDEGEDHVIIDRRLAGGDR
jgi:hypothetical protein